MIEQRGLAAGQRRDPDLAAADERHTVALGRDLRGMSLRNLARRRAGPDDHDGLLRPGGIHPGIGIGTAEKLKVAAAGVDHAPVGRET